MTTAPHDPRLVPAAESADAPQPSRPRRRWFSFLWPTAAPWHGAPEDRRKALDRMANAKHDRRAADHLWRQGHSERAAELAALAFKQLTDVAALLSRQPAPEGQPLDLKLDIKQPAAPSSNERPLSQYERYSVAYSALEKDLRWDLTGQRQLRWARLVRLALLLLVLSTGVALFVLAARRPRLETSAEFAPTYAGKFAADGLMATEWLLPNQSAGWLEFSFRAPRPLHTVKVCNAHNTSFLDRATKEFRVESYLGTTLLETQTGSFPRIRTEPTCRDVKLRGEPVDHVVVHVVSYFSLGGGLAEVELH